MSEAGNFLPCVIGVYCHKHGFIHGAEAEELRERIEKLVSEYREAKRDAEADCPHDIAPVGIIHENAIRALSGILDTVDARDSVAWLEFRDAEPGVPPAARPPQAKEEIAWLIALGSSTPQWWTGRGDNEWTAEVDGTQRNPAHTAIRFARKEDAERAIGWLVKEGTRDGCKAEEHIWL